MKIFHKLQKNSQIGRITFRSFRAIGIKNFSTLIDTDIRTLTRPGFETKMFAFATGQFILGLLEKCASMEQNNHVSMSFFIKHSFHGRIPL